MKSGLNKYIQLAFWLTGFLIISRVIGEMTRNNMAGWYDQLEKPGFNPPDIAFPIVWTLLYVILAVVGWRLSAHRREAAGRTIFAVFLLQMILNWGWSFVFFHFHLLGPSFFWIVGLVAINLWLAIKLWRRDHASALMLIPYIMWIGFASGLSLAIWLLNT